MKNITAKNEILEKLTAEKEDTKKALDLAIKEVELTKTELKLTLKAKDDEVLLLLLIQ